MKKTKTKICARCGREKPCGDFYKQTASRDGYDSYCKECRSNIARQYYQDHKEEDAARKQDWRDRVRRGEPPKTRSPEYIEDRQRKKENHQRAIAQRKEVRNSPIRKMSSRIIASLQSRKFPRPGKNRSISCSVCREDIEELWYIQQGRDAYTGLPMVLSSPKTNPRQPSVDRIDSSKGYTKTNICLCCLWVNKAKGDLSAKDFLDLLKELRESS